LKRDPSESTFENGWSGATKGTDRGVEDTGDFGREVKAVWVGESLHEEEEGEAAEAACGAARVVARAGWAKGAVISRPKLIGPEGSHSFTATASGRQPRSIAAFHTLQFSSPLHDLKTPKLQNTSSAVPPPSAKYPGTVSDE